MVNLRRVSVLGVLLTSLGCIDGPFERVNPHDEGATYEMLLQASRDTVTAAETDVAIQVISHPNVRGYPPRWSSDYEHLVHLGDGLFRLTLPSPVVAPITIRARYLSREISVVIYRAPAP